MSRAEISWSFSKKKSKLALEADPQQRAEFREKQKQLNAEDLIFIDEYGINLAMSRTHARAEVGKRAEVREAQKVGRKISVIQALGLKGVEATMMIEGSFDTQSFEQYIEQMVVPRLEAGKIVLLDNIRFHYSSTAIRMIEEAGARVIYLPIYSPDLNPIEECISKIKGILRGMKARTKRKLYKALAKAIEMVTESDIRGWFKHCGYVYSLN